MIRFLAGILLLLALLFQALAWPVLLHQQQSRQRKAVKTWIRKSLPEPSLTQFTWTLKEYEALSWVERGREFRYQGELYDIVRLEKRGGSLRISCIRDQDEEALLDRMAQQHPFGRNAAKLLLSVVSLPFLIPSVHALPAPPFRAARVNFRYQALRATFFKETSSPPPQFV